MSDSSKKDTILTLFENFYSNESDDNEDNSSELSSDISDSFEKRKKSDQLDQSVLSEEKFDLNENNKSEDLNLKWRAVAKKLKISKNGEQDSRNNTDVEYTLAIIKPNALKYQTDIEEIITNARFEICNKKILQTTPEQMMEFYSIDYEEESSSLAIEHMASGPIVVLVLCKHRAIDEWRKLIGPIKVSDAVLYFPNSIRAKFGDKEDDYKNAVHGSSTNKNAQEEIKFFFPDFIFDPILTNDDVENYLWNNINPILIEGIADCCKKKPKDPLLWLINWLMENNPNTPRIRYNI